MVIVSREDILTCTDIGVLCEALKTRFSNILKNVAEISAIVKRLDDLGAEITIDNALLPYYRLIGHGQLSANCFAALCGEPALLEKVMRLPLPTQEKFANNEPIKVMEVNGDHRMVPPLDMTPRERQQVFRGKRLRTDTEQIGWLRDQQQKATAKSLPSDNRPIRVDRKRKGLVVGDIFIPLSELAGYVASISQI